MKYKLIFTIFTVLAVCFFLFGSNDEKRDDSLMPVFSSFFGYICGNDAAQEVFGFDDEMYREAFGEDFSEFV